MKTLIEKHLVVLGQLGGYGAGVGALVGEVKDVIGLIGVICGTALSVWALVDRIQKARRKGKSEFPISLND